MYHTTHDIHTHSLLFLSNLLFPCLRTDNTEQGYALGLPEQRETLPSPERSLSPAACAILRAIMHSALLWASCNNEENEVSMTPLHYLHRISFLYH